MRNPHLITRRQAIATGLASAGGLLLTACGAEQPPTYGNLLRMGDLLTYRARAPYAEENHPTEEHLLPLYVALGAAGPFAHARRLHTSATYGVLRMDAYAFGNEADLQAA